MTPDQIEAEYEWITGLHREIDCDCSSCRMINLIEAMRAEMGRLREDAERYILVRSLMRQLTPNSVGFERKSFNKLGPGDYYPSELFDEAVDTARRGAP